MLDRESNLIPMFFDILAKFRTNVIALMADIEKAFLQIGIKEGDREFLRVLLYDDQFAATRSVIKLRYTHLPFGLKPFPTTFGSYYCTMCHHTKKKKQKNLRQLRGSATRFICQKER